MAYESMYESPFSLQISEMCDEIAKSINNDTETAVMRSIADIGINVDKEELIKALQYDRDQYNKGYSDGARFGFEAGKPKWIPVSEEPPKEMGTYMTTVNYGEHGLAVGQRYYYGEGLGWDDDCVIAWMPLPAPYEPKESEEIDVQNDEH